MLIAAAYGLNFPTIRISGGPDWVASDRFAERFSVEAVAEPGAIPENLAPSQLRKQLQAMLRRLLEERFRLVLRTEQKDVQVYKLNVAPTGTKLTKSSISETQCVTPAAPIACHNLDGARPRGMMGDAVSLDEVAALLEASSDVPIVNATGIKDLFSIKLGPYSRVTPQIFPEEIERLPADRRPPPEPWPSVFKVLEQELGLQLVAGRAQVDMLRIESIQKPEAN